MDDPRPTPAAPLRPSSLAEAGATAAAMLPEALRMRHYRQFYREAEDDFSFGFRSYTLRTYTP